MKLIFIVALYANSVITHGMQVSPFYACATIKMELEACSFQAVCAACSYTKSSLTRHFRNCCLVGITACELFGTRMNCIDFEVQIKVRVTMRHHVIRLALQEAFSHQNTQLLIASST